MTCPRCLTKLTPASKDRNILGCPHCGGRWVSYSKFAENQKDVVLREFISEAKITDSKKLKCPSCQKLMKSVQTPENNRPIDTCIDCQYIWFDFLEHETFKGRDTQKRGRLFLSPRPIELGSLQIDVVQSGRFAPFTDPRFYESNVINDRVQVQFPLVTYLSLLISVLVFLKFRHNLSDLWVLWGFEAGKHNFHNLIKLPTSFFIHGNWWHLISNMYFLWIFGSDVESDKDPWQLLILFSGGHIFGIFAQSLLSPSGTFIGGASAGIYSAAVFYAISFPKARIQGFIPLRGRRPFISRNSHYIYWSTTAGVFLTFMVLNDLISLATSKNGNVAHLAHIVGAFFGVAWSVLDSSKKPQSKD